MPTAGHIAEKISELRSKIAVTQGIVLHLRANFLSSNDKVPAEMYITRSDGTTVSSPHIEAAIEDYLEYMGQLTTELEHWENTQIPDLMDSKPNGAKKKKTKTKETANAATGSQRGGEAASGDDEG